MKKRIVLAITGASGAPYALRLLALLADAGVAIHLIISKHGRRLLHEEAGLSELSAETLVGPEWAHMITLHPNDDIGAQPASGSFITDGMIVCPCSSNTLGGIAGGIGSNLILRAAAVHLKEHRPLILVPRETPLSQIEIRNMLRVSQAGAIVCPAAPGFYLKPTSIDDLTDFMAGKVCDLIGLPHALHTRWQPDRGSG